MFEISASLKVSEYLRSSGLGIRGIDGYQNMPQSTLLGNPVSLRICFVLQLDQRFQLLGICRQYIDIHLCDTRVRQYFVTGNLQGRRNLRVTGQSALFRLLCQQTPRVEVGRGSGDIGSFAEHRGTRSIRHAKRISLDVLLGDFDSGGAGHNNLLAPCRG
ncbi:hypothetical protein ASE76_09300 [Xylophilus sp. Leaf220]|nr:hypothetical protein ASE76_09300 [Xylophilus sp. Leaf220]